MACWLVKSDPETYGFADLERDRKTVWDGVSNALALQHLRKVRKGDSVLVYHSGAEKAIVGIAKAASDAYADPKAGDAKLAVFEIQGTTVFLRCRISCYRRKVHMEEQADAFDDSSDREAYECAPTRQPVNKPKFWHPCDEDYHKRCRS